MKKSSFIPAFSVLIIILIFGLSTTGFAQFREDLTPSGELTGPIIKEDPSQGAHLGNLFNMTMDHSYSMTFSSFGGQAQNINAYTNTMHFFFTEDLTGRVDLSLLHSPFGNTMMSQGNNTMGTDLLIRNAELNYQINEKSSFSIQFQQLPNYGMNPWGRNHYNNPFYSPFQDRNF